MIDDIEHLPRNPYENLRPRWLGWVWIAAPLITLGILWLVKP